MNKFKKLFTLILSVAMIVSLTACGNKDSKTEEEETTVAAVVDNGENDEQNLDAYEDSSDETTTAASIDSDNDNKTTNKAVIEKTTLSNASDTKIEKQKIYDAYAEQLKKTCKDGYYLYDMDGNGIPELFVGEEGRMFSVYSYKNGLQKIDDITSYGSTLYINENGEGLIFNRSLRETTTLSYLTIKRGQLKQEEFLFAKAEDGSFDEKDEQIINDSCKRALCNGSENANGADTDLSMLKEVVMNGSKTANIGG